MKFGLKIVFLLLAIMTGKELFAQNNLTYKQLIDEADLYLKVGEIGFARIDYDKAILVNPSDEYPRLKLAEIDRKAITQRRIDSLFENSMVNAEKYFKSGNYNLAQIEYNRSLELKPESVFIKDRLASISTKVTKSEPAKTIPSKQDIVNDKPITKAVLKESIQPSLVSETKKTVSEQLPKSPTPLQVDISQAEDFLSAKDYVNAVQRYQTALSLKPGDKSIKLKLTSTLALLDNQKKEQKVYSDIILAAEKANVQKNTQLALTYYEKAAILKPDDAGVLNKLIALRDQLNVEQSLEKDLKKIIVKADQSFHNNNLPEAKKYYEQARTLKPDDKYSQDKLLEIGKIEAITEVENSKKYKETLVLAESLLNQEDFQGAYQAFSKASVLQPNEGFPKQKMTELTTKIAELEAQYKIAYTGYVNEANKAYRAKNWDVAMDNYLQALKAKNADTLSMNQMNRIVSYLDKKLITTLTPPSATILQGKEVKLPFTKIELTKRTNHYFIVRVKNSEAGSPRLYISFGQDTQKNGGIIYRNILKGGQYIDYVIRLVNQDRWYRLDNNWISFTVEGGSLQIENLKICADI
jgi:tetratricopeptide (TPR) repeat protein